MFTDGQIWCQTISYSLLACYRWKQNWKITSATDFMAFLVKALFWWNECAKIVDISILTTSWQFFSWYRETLPSKVCTISFERPVNYLCDAWHVFPLNYEAWTHFNRPWTEYQCQGAVWTLLIIFTESVNRSTCLSVYLIITGLRNVNLLCFSDSIEGIDFLNCTLKCPVTLKLANQNRFFC